MNDTIIKTLCEQVVTKNGFLYIDTIVRGHKNAVVIEVFMDSPGVLTIDDCALVSRELDTLLNESLSAGENFRLDVSSPGIDRPLKYLVQFPKNTDRRFDIVYREEENEIKFTGKLKAVEGSNLIFTNKNNQEKTIPYDSVVSAQMQVSFS